MEIVLRVGIFLHALKYTGSLNVQYVLHYAFAIPKLNVNNYALLVKYENNKCTRIPI